MSSGHFIYVSKDVRIRVFVTAKKGSSSRKLLGNANL